VSDPSLPILDLVGGVVACGDGSQAYRAVRSLLDQTLPPTVRWSTIWVVVAPDDPTTLDAAERAVRSDPRVRLVRESRRRGKSAALVEVLRRAQGDLLILLNGDAEAEPGAVDALVRAAGQTAAPVFGVMGRVVLPRGDPSGLRGALELLWGLHHRFHAELYARHEGTHLSDELLGLPIANLPPLAEGIINDGAFSGAWIASHGGELLYAESARVRISLPRRFIDLLRQRRRIHVGHHQVEALSGRRPSTIEGMAVRQPRRALAIVRAEVRSRADGVRAMVVLVAAEVAAFLLSRLDLLGATSGWAVWPRVEVVRTEAPSEGPVPGTAV
jgi:hypothetical protein